MHNLVMEILSLQGITVKDYPILSSWCMDEKKKRVLRDLAGNSFSTLVAQAVMLAVCVSVGRLGGDLNEHRS